MSKYKDIQGKVFNDLTAISHQGSDKTGQALWLFRCICGNEKVFTGRCVVKGDTLSCGCRRSRNCKLPKNCIHCGLPSTRKNRHGNVASVCQKCHNKQTNGFKTFNPKHRMVASARNRSREYGIPCTITHNDFEIPEVCPIFGIQLEFGTTAVHDRSPSLDRIIPHLGYVPGNVAVISHRANQIKNSGTAEEHRKIADWIEQSQCPSISDQFVSLMKIAKPMQSERIAKIQFSDEHRAKLSLVASKRWKKKREMDALESLFA